MPQTQTRALAYCRGVLWKNSLFYSIRANDEMTTDRRFGFRVLVPTSKLATIRTQERHMVSLMKLVYIVFAACFSTCAGLSTGSLRPQSVRPHLVPARTTFCRASDRPEPRSSAYALQLIGTDDDLASVPTPSPAPHPPAPVRQPACVPFTPASRSTLPLPAQRIVGGQRAAAGAAEGDPCGAGGDRNPNPLTLTLTITLTPILTPTPTLTLTPTRIARRRRWRRWGRY